MAGAQVRLEVGAFGVCGGSCAARGRKRGLGTTLRSGAWVAGRLQGLSIEVGRGVLNLNLEILVLLKIYLKNTSRCSWAMTQLSFSNL